MTEIEWIWRLRIYTKISHLRLAFLSFQWHNIQITYGGGSRLVPVCQVWFLNKTWFRLARPNLPRVRLTRAIMFLNETEILLFFLNNTIQICIVLIVSFIWFNPELPCNRLRNPNPHRTLLGIISKPKFYVFCYHWSYKRWIRCSDHSSGQRVRSYWILNPPSNESISS